MEEQPGQMRPLSPTRAMRILKSSVAHALISKDKTRTQETASFVHFALLGGDSQIVRVEAKNFRTKAAKQARDEAREARKIPMLAEDLDELTAGATIVRPKLLRFGYDKFETKIAWLGNGVECRGCLDMYGKNGLIIGDVKTCGSGEARRWSSPKMIAACGYDVQAAAYVEGLASLNQLDPVDIKYRLHYVETEPPYDVLTVELGQSMLELGRRRWNRAREMWRKAYETGVFAGYGDVIQIAEADKWDIAAEEERMLDDNAAAAGELPF